MNFRTFNDLNQSITQHLHKMPRDIDLVAGIPRSGLIPANLIALYLNKPLADLDGLLEGRTLSVGQRLGDQSTLPSNPHVLLVDDSISTGHALDRAKNKIASSTFTGSWQTLVIYAENKSKHKVDHHLEICPQPRMFQWNWAHSGQLSNACLDIDGVLCVDPTVEQNDDGSNYIDFIRTAQPLNIPTTKVGALVTSRLEKYRAHTEAWLTQHNIQYDQLIMLDLPDAETRRRLRTHAAHKAAFYKKSRYNLFVESAPQQAITIAQTTGKAVFCTDNQSFHPPTTTAQLNHHKNQITAHAHYKYSHWMMRIQNKIHKISKGVVGRRAA
ncbi:phosphoribosyltransferase family protein [Poriferisphaera sp. WC338]|uniref:phosphoribosyltransferase n=1 Tax=Poriferisphaera sp. WC338 TaxID=3425129 RepID=UPI003D81AAC2